MNRIIAARRQDLQCDIIPGSEDRKCSKCGCDVVCSPQSLERLAQDPFIVLVCRSCGGTKDEDMMGLVAFIGQRLIEINDHSGPCLIRFDKDENGELLRNACSNCCDRVFPLQVEYANLKTKKGKE